MLLPALMPVTTPDELTVATAVVPETHGPTAAGEGDPANVVVDPAHTVSVPVMAGNAFTTTFTSSVDGVQGALVIFHLRI